MGYLTLWFGFDVEREKKMDKLQWGSRKRLRCVKVKEEAEGVKKKITSRVDRRVVASDDNNNHHHHQESVLLQHPPLISPNRLNRDLGMNRSNGNENLKMSTSSPEKEDRYYTTRGSSMGILDDNSKMFVEARNDKKKIVWPKLFIALSNKEKEEDFMAMKGCKPPHRPKKRAKLIQKTILFVSPGQWLSDLCQERYEVREKKTSKKRPRGLKAMGNMDSDSE